MGWKWGAAGAAGGVLNPQQAKMSTGGPVTLPTLKMHRETEVVLTIAPSGSGSGSGSGLDARDAAIALSAWSVLLLAADFVGVIMI